MTTEADLDRMVTHTCFDTYAVSFSEENGCKATIGRAMTTISSVTDKKANR